MKQQAKLFILLMQEGKFITHLVVGIGVRVALCAVLAAGAQRHGAEAVSSEAAQPAQILDDFLPLRRSPSSSLLLKLEVEYAELELTLLAPTIAQALPRIFFFLERRSFLFLLLCLLL
jgi:hypothetical protein